MIVLLENPKGIANAIVRVACLYKFLLLVKSLAENTVAVNPGVLISREFSYRVFWFCCGVFILARQSSILFISASFPILN